MEDVEEIFEELEDPRTGNAKRHVLHEILVIACARFCAAGRPVPTWRCLAVPSTAA